MIQRYAGAISTLLQYFSDVALLPAQIEQKPIDSSEQISSRV